MTRAQQPFTIVTVVGARPQFIKAAPVSKALKAVGLREILVHTGQHFDDNMSAVFFASWIFPRPPISSTLTALATAP
jgi:UDP-N-acetylglucosamine 2-epimerase